MTIAILILLAYLIGSVPTAVWYGKAFHKIDVREHGSGNAGATNTLRILGNKAGFIVLFIDLLKGFLATSLIHFSDLEIGTQNYFNFQMALGVTAVLGHVFPLFAGFKGGKGIATLLGMCIAINWQIAIICILVFVIIVAITKYISVGSMSAAILAAILSFYFYTNNVIANCFFCAIAILVIYTHRTNIVRLKAGTENKLSFKKK
ncbi:MAG: glycerol-3-phosphate 1-O-acyltransferase PlsY [Bacteroidia bacterium]|nr:glycerol-3-phosphate 1-O-acyltransferase PlsY [Bacteroidia bacterium]